MRLIIGSDHCGFPMKERLLPHLKANHEVVDVGCYSTDMVDFPDVAKKVCNAILDGSADRGIMFCSTGVGAAIACNKVKGIRAGVCNDVYSAHQSVEHDDVQILTMGGDIVGYYIAREIVDAFCGATFSTDDEFRVRVHKLKCMESPDLDISEVV